MLSLLILSFLIQSPSDCKFKAAKDDVFKLERGKRSFEIVVAERDAKLLKCQTLASDSNFLLAEIDTGTAGTFAKTNEVVLFIFDLKKTDSSPMVKKVIRESTRQMNIKSGKESMEVTENAYEIRVEGNGTPAIYWKNTKRLEPLVLQTEN